MSAPAEPVVSRRDWTAVFGGVLGAFMSILDIQISNSALRDITGALGATFDEGSWITLSYLLPEIVMIPLAGWLAQIVGIRRFLLWNIVLFLSASIACGYAWSLGSIMAFRFAQGLAGGTFVPLAFNIILTKLPASKRPVGFALYGITGVIAPAIGPALGGWLTEHFGWPSIFLINVFPGLLMAGLLLRSLDHEAGKPEMLRGADWCGIATMAVGLSAFTYFLEEGNRKDWFGSNEIRFTFWTAVLSLGAFVVIELTSRRPVLNLRLFKNGNFLVGSAINLTVGAGLYGSIYLLPLYLGQQQGYSALQIGQTLLWLGIPQALTMPISARLTPLVDKRLLVGIGLLLFAGGSLLTGQMDRDVAHDQLRLPQLLRAIGFPLIFVPITTIATSGIGPAEAASASGLFNMMRNLGGSIGIALLGTLLTRREHFHSSHLGESISAFDLPTMERLAALTAQFVAAGNDAVTAGRMALGALDATVRSQAYFLAFGDCFKALGLAFLACLILLPFCKVTAGGGKPGS